MTEAPLALSVAPSSGPRGRLLIACLAVSVLASVVCLEFAWPTLLGQRPPLIWNVFLFALVHYASLGTLLMYPLSRHGPDSITLLPDVSRALQAQLKSDGALLEAARAVI